MKKPTPISAGELEKRKERLRSIGIKEIPSTVPKLKLKGKEVRIQRSEYAKHYYDVKVKNLDHLKQLVGNPDRSLESNGKRNFVPFPMDACEVPDVQLNDFTKHSQIEQIAIHKAAKNLVYGHSNALRLQESQVDFLANWIMKHGGHLPVFQSPDLEVMDGTTVIFTGAAVLHFHSVTVHGSGSIKFEDSVKMITDEMHVVP